IPLPAALGEPDRVYLIQARRPVVVLAWLNADGTVKASLHLLPQDTYVLKMTSGTPEDLKVNSADALWVSNPHWYMLQTSSSAFQLRNVPAHALIWQAADGMTYRLETNLPLDEALPIAESVPVG